MESKEGFGGWIHVHGSFLLESAPLTESGDWSWTRCTVEWA
ncbi:hypothetical protein [Paenibacillus sp. Y412MC10]|nr:hypothetical protein [Paenibacillus sp. Y412MC10]